MMKGLADAIKQHQSEYTKQSSLICHYIGATLLYLSALIFLGWIHIGIPGIFSLSFAWIFIIAAVAYYAKHCWKTAIGIAVALVLLNLIACFYGPSWFGLGALCVFLIAGIALEIVADSMEGRKPNPSRHVCVLISAPPIFVNQLYTVIPFDKITGSITKKKDK